MPTILLGVDGGGTGTRAVLLEATSQPLAPPNHLLLRQLGRGQAPSSNRYSAGWPDALSSVLQAARQAFASAGLDPDHAQRDPTIRWGLGLAGVVSCTDIEDWRQHLQPHLTPSSHLLIGDDALAAQSGAFAGGPGAILIAGTGANAFGRDARGKTVRADGLGPLLGDRGSGFWIGEQALRAITRHHDRVAHCPLLHSAILTLLDVPDVPSLIALVYAPAWTKDRTAALSRPVQEAAESGDALARGILSAAGTELAHTAHTVLASLELSKIALSGGVLQHISPVRHAFASTLQDALPHARIVPPLHDASIGAALLAAEE